MAGIRLPHWIWRLCQQPSTLVWRGRIARHKSNVSTNKSRIRSPIITSFTSVVPTCNERRWSFRRGDMVWVHLRKEHFPGGRARKLQPSADGPFRVLKRINDNVYKIDLPSHYNVSATFNVADLSSFLPELDNPLDLRLSPLEDGEDDAVGLYRLGPNQDNGGGSG
uniref:Tf2-1-like SH3-like domain-containing protein n=1 Tax=Lactuca sativa TaxID=4236 RepID=A0A9R1UE60_LACSA|nr:hypothetical protein LSAT_V11C900503070 [Lactuca sativa]